MNRRAVLAVAVPFIMTVPTRALSASRSVVVVVASSEPDVDDGLEDSLAGALRERGVVVVDPSSINTTYHHRARLLAIRTFGGGLIDYSSIAWVETKYHSDRAMFATIRFSTQTLPYGGFNVHVVRATCAYRCFDILHRGIVAAGSFHAESRGEDYAAVRDRAAAEAMLAAARHAAPRLRS